MALTLLFLYLGVSQFWLQVVDQHLEKAINKSMPLEIINLITNSCLIPEIYFIKDNNIEETDTYQVHHTFPQDLEQKSERYSP